MSLPATSHFKYWHWVQLLHSRAAEPVAKVDKEAEVIKKSVQAEAKLIKVETKVEQQKLEQVNRLFSRYTC